MRKAEEEENDDEDEDQPPPVFRADRARNETKQDAGEQKNVAELIVAPAWRHEDQADDEAENGEQPRDQRPAAPVEVDFFAH